MASTTKLLQKALVEVSLTSRNSGNVQNEREGQFEVYGSGSMQKRCLRAGLPRTKIRNKIRSVENPPPHPKELPPSLLFQHIDFVSGVVHNTQVNIAPVPCVHHFMYASPMSGCVRGQAEDSNAWYRQGESEVDVQSLYQPGCTFYEDATAKRWRSAGPNN